jgi:putative transposase
LLAALSGNAVRPRPSGRGYKAPLHLLPLALSQQTYRETGRGLNYHAHATRLPKLKQEHEWWQEADSQVLQASLQNLAAAFDSFFQKRAKYPSFKSRHGRQSIQYPQRVKVEGGRIRLPKVGLVKIVEHRPVDGRIKTVTISREPCGHYYASILTEDARPTPTTVMPEGGRFTGIDVGLIDFAVTGNSQHFANPKHLSQAERNLKRKQRKLSRKQKGSKSRDKSRRLVARCHARVKNIRKDFLHQLSRKPVDENQALAVEDLNVKAMVKAPTLAKAISDAGWGMFTRFCQYKAERAAKPFLRVGRFFRRPRRALVAGAAATRCRCPFANGHVLDAALSTTGTRTPRRTSASKPIVYGPLEEGLLLVEAMSDMGVGVSWRIVQLPLRPEAPPFRAGCFTLLGSFGRFAGNTILVGFRTGRSAQESFGRKSSLQQLANSRRPARHTLREAEIVHSGQFLRVQHNLETFCTLPC